MTHNEQDIERVAYRKEQEAWLVWRNSNMRRYGYDAKSKARDAFAGGYSAALDAMGPREAVSREQVGIIAGYLSTTIAPFTNTGVVHGHVKDALRAANVPVAGDES